MTTAKTVKVEADIVAGVLKWKVDSQAPKDAKLYLPPKSGDAEIEFGLHDNAKQGLRFDCSNPFWVDEDLVAAQCPGTGIKTDQIEVIECKPASLKITDKNDKHARTLNYRLNFKDSAGIPHDVDPEIKNGGG